MQTKLKELIELVEAIKHETYGGIYACDIHETNWFDKRDEVLSRIKAEKEKKHLDNRQNKCKIGT